MSVVRYAVLPFIQAHVNTQGDAWSQRNDLKITVANNGDDVSLHNAASATPTKTYSKMGLFNMNLGLVVHRVEDNTHWLPVVMNELLNHLSRHDANTPHHLKEARPRSENRDDWLGESEIVPCA